MPLRNPPPLTSEQEAAIRKEVQDELTRKNVTIKGRRGSVRFHFRRMPATKGDEVLEGLREVAGGDFLSDDPTVFTTLVTKLPRAYVKRLQERLFRYVDFETDRSSKMCLSGLEDQAFNDADLEPIAIKQVLLRSFAVNFIGSFQQLSAGTSWIGNLISSQRKRS